MSVVGVSVAVRGLIKAEKIQKLIIGEEANREG